MAVAEGHIVVWRSFVLLILTVLICCVYASPSVRVALQTSFNSAPYLLELLESAAEENPASYFPILDRIADGAFSNALTDRELYDRFLDIIHEDGHFTTPEALSSFKLSLAIRSAAPRIEAHYQFYNTSVQHSLAVAQDAVCHTWVHADGKQYCSSSMERAQQDVLGEENPRELPFDRALGDSSLPPAVLYADIASPMFGQFHQTLSALAREGQISYRVRYRAPQHWSPRPLFTSGYGVELALKRTDYIVIDDRDAEHIDHKDTENEQSSGTEDFPNDLRPLSSSEVARLGYNTVAYVADSEDPLETLVRLSEDFPKYSPQIAAHNATASLLEEIRSNRGRMLPAGINALWINGVQISAQQVDAFSLLDQLRRERKLIERFTDIGLSAQETVNLLSHQFTSGIVANDEPARFNYQDKHEGGRVIIWMNDLEKDLRYQSWNNDLIALLQPIYPGQLPPIRRDIHNLVFPVDLTKIEDLELIVGVLRNLVNKKVPIRIGLVPIAVSPNSVAQLKVAHYLQETYGLATLLEYFEKLASKKLTTSSKPSFQSVTKDRSMRTGKESLSYEEILKSEDLDTLVSMTTDYQVRLGIKRDATLAFANGVPLARNDQWTQQMSFRISRDLQLIQQGIMEGNIEENTWLPGVFLSQAYDRRNPVIIPDDPKDIQLPDITKAYETMGWVLDGAPRIESAEGALKSIQVIVIGDFDSDHGSNLLDVSLDLRREQSDIELIFLHNPDKHALSACGSVKLNRLLQKGDARDAAQAIADLHSSGCTEPAASDSEARVASEFWKLRQPLAAKLGFPRGTGGILVNGRAIGPFRADLTLTRDDLMQLVAYERRNRIDSVTKAIVDLELDSRISTVDDLAKLTSLVALSSIPSVPEGITEVASDIRINIHDKWNSSSRSVITIADSEDPTISIAASIDPASLTAQKWLPILRILSRLAGVKLQIFLNPQENIDKLPIKRFYRYVLDSEPAFDDDGSLLSSGASFSGLPAEALLTLGMDVPSPWLVAPKDSEYDLDNIRLSSLKAESNVEAIYALEHILIEGHSRDLTAKSPPRGVQLVLGTDANTHLTDTIIMANLGYFQFKAQPGLWKINLKPGRSERIFNLDSVGGLGYNPQPGDDNNDVALLSFQGKTLFPRLSRKSGHETDDVLEAGGSTNSAMDYISKGLSFASEILSRTSAKSSGGGEHADINIFSVASGHLYERMLNIMMTSVTRNTKHTVKFWFIEQFLSPSFKSFLPHLATELNFSYEMVTYKWPHWLRGQSEKQREIWGYKILFLDVLFPLSLEKVIFVDADQIVRTDMYDLTTFDLDGAPYGFVPMCDSRIEMEGFRFWKQGYWKNFLNGAPYHISALYVVDLNRFRALGAGDRLRGQYQVLSADPGSLSNLDQDLPNSMQHSIPIKSLPQDWLWCETWCDDESLQRARTIDLCNNPLTKEPKLERARRQVPEWTTYDEEIAEFARRVAYERASSHSPDLAEAPSAKDEGDEWKKDEL